MEERKIHIDLLRVIAIFFVVLLHVAAVNFNTVTINSYSWRVMNVADSLCRWAVPCFVMLSGVFFLDSAKSITMKKLFGKYILRIMLAFVVFSLFYAIVNPVLWHIGEEKSFLESFVNGYYHLWFLYMLLGLYLLAPILRAISANKQLTQYFLLLFVIVAFILPLFNGSSIGEYMSYPLEKMNLSLFCSFSGYWLLGLWLNKYAKLSSTHKSIIYILAVMAFAFTVFVTNFLSAKYGKANDYWYQYIGINVALMACGVFVFFEDKVAPLHFSQKAKQAIGLLSKNAFGIYLIHPFFLDAFRCNGVSSLSFNPLLSIPLIALLCFNLSFLISWLLRLIPVVKKYIL